MASEVHINEMRTLLELHYDAVHIADWRAKFDETKRKMPGRKGEFKVFQSVVDALTGTE